MQHIALRPKTIFIGTPSYSGPCPDYQLSLLKTIPAVEQAGYRVMWKTLEGCCYVHTARNKIVQSFLLSEADELLFWDDDIGVESVDILRLLERDEDIVGGAAPFRHGTIGFPIHHVVTATGHASNMKDGMLEVDVLPTALMKIKRRVFIELGKAGKAPLRIEGDRETGEENGRYLSLFDFECDNEKHLEYGEDVTFCRKWTAVGGTLWCEPNMTIRHHGKNYREGNFLTHLRELKGGDLEGQHDAIKEIAS